MIAEPRSKKTMTNEMVRQRNQQEALYEYEDDKYKPEVVEAGHW